MAATKKLKLRSTHIVTILDHPHRLSDYLIGVFDEIPSRKGIKKAIKRGLVYLNHQPGATGDWVAGGDQIDLYEQPTLLSPLQYKLDVLHEDQHLAAVYKPAKILVSGNHHFTLERALPYNIAASCQEDAFTTARPVHRLDYETAGIVLIAKTRSAYTHLQSQFYDRLIIKKYLAICCGELPKEGRVDHCIDGREAITDFFTHEQIHSAKYGPLSLVAFDPVTGRTHQIRIHAAFLGCPIIGDKLYSNTAANIYRKCHMLLAQAITFNDTTDKRIHITAQIPRRMSRFFPSLIK